MGHCVTCLTVCSIYTNTLQHLKLIERLFCCTINSNSNNITTIMNTTPQQVWTEKYRPHSIDDLILPDEYKQSFKGKPQNFLFYGSQGNGKTTAMRALADYYTDKHSQLLINASECNGVDTVRSMITEFCTHVSLASSGIKVVMLDEIDYMTTQAQMAMRGTTAKCAGTLSSFSGPSSSSVPTCCSRAGSSPPCSRRSTMWPSPSAPSSRRRASARRILRNGRNFPRPCCSS